MLASQKPGVPKRKFVTESAVLPSPKLEQCQYSSRVANDMTSRFLLTLPSLYSQYSIVS